MAKAKKQAYYIIGDDCYCNGPHASLEEAKAAAERDHSADEEIEIALVVERSDPPKAKHVWVKA